MHCEKLCLAGVSGYGVVFMEVTFERRPELIQLVLARLAVMADAWCASCVDPAKAPWNSACSMPPTCRVTWFVDVKIWADPDKQAENRTQSVA